MSHYVRARHYSNQTKVWTTRDPLWPEESPYFYCHNLPVSLIDPSGYAPSLLCLIPCVPCTSRLIDYLIVYPPGPGWLDCVKSVWNELPAGIKWTCGLACCGCFYCLLHEPIPPIERHNPELLTPNGPLPAPKQPFTYTASKSLLSRDKNSTFDT